jgi:hypothetical protein
MTQTGRMPFRGSATLGRGVNILTGEIVGKALTVKNTESATTGQEATYDIQIVETHESLMESLGLSMEASGRYGMFSAEGKFSLSEKSKFNAQSTFVVASCRVQNAFIQIDQFEVAPEVKPFLEDKEKFKTAFGTHFVRGHQTGGEFFIVLQTMSTSQEIQSSLSASFQASCQGLIAAGDFQTAYDQAKASTSQKTSISILMYQKAGQDEQIGFVNNPAEIIQRLRDFPKFARQNPGGYEIEYADYNTLALPLVNEQEVIDREMSLNDCARLRLKYMTRRNDIEFARENRVFFIDLPPDEVLGKMYDNYSQAVRSVQLHAQKIANRTIAPAIFVLPEGLELPVVNFTRINIPSDIPVPNLVGNTVDNAKSQLTSLGLEAEMNLIPVTKEAGLPLNIVTNQGMQSGTKVPPKTRVLLTANYIPADRFSWLMPIFLAQGGIKKKPELNINLAGILLKK